MKNATLPEEINKNNLSAKFLISLKLAIFMQKELIF